MGKGRERGKGKGKDELAKCIDFFFGSAVSRLEYFFNIVKQYTILTYTTSFHNLFAYDRNM